MRHPSRTLWSAAAAAIVLPLLAVVPSEAVQPSAAPAAVEASTTTYLVDGVRDRAARSAVAATGAALVDVQDHGRVLVTATPAEAQAIRAAGYAVSDAESVTQVPRTSGRVGTNDFPVQDSAYHTYSEMSSELAAVASANPSIVSRRSVGRSYEGRELWAAKISDAVGTDENEPEVLFTCNQHAREHLSVEMCLYLLNELTSKYASDSRVRNLVDSREIWIVFMVNPDGVEYDVATGSYRSWRKNRQPNAGSSYVGTDLNRNWGYRWGCCGGSSGSTSSDTYRGTAAFSAPETRALADFVLSRKVNGVQQIRSHIDFHTYSELILWPYGYTYADTDTGLTQDDRDAHAALGREMAASNGYAPQQASDLYVTDGGIDDWLWGAEKIFTYTFEMYPGSASGGGFYPPDEVIGRETARNREAVLDLLDASDCVYEVIGKAAQYCGGTTNPPPAGQRYTNGTDVVIRDLATVESPITVSGRTGSTPATTNVEVTIRHTYRGDLRVDLVSPAGRVYTLHDRTGGSADDVVGTYPVTLTSEPLNGTWRLRVTDAARGDIGTIDTWSLTL